MGGHTLWTRDRHTYWALGSLFYHRRRQPRPEPGTYQRPWGLTVTIGMANRSYGRGVGKPITDRTVTHATDRVGIAWRSGQVVGTMCLWLCGGVTTEFELSDDVRSRWCSTCWHRLHPEHTGIVIHNLYIDNRSS